MKKWTGVVITGLLLLTAVPPLLADGLDKLVPTDARVCAKDFGQWAGAWQQWAMGLPVDKNPWFDETGALTASGQSGDVWFLTGVVNSSGTVVRTATIPQGKYLFFPVLNGECSNIEPAPWYGKTQKELVDCATLWLVTGLYASLDGNFVPSIDPNCLVLSPLYSIWVPENNALGIPGPQHGISVTYGAYIMLAPLSPGTHTIQFGGTFVDDKGNPTWVLNITYHLTVE